MNPETQNALAPAEAGDETPAADQVQRKDTEPTEEAAKKVPSAEPGASDTAIATAVHSAKAEAVAIAELCQLAGQSHRIATFLTQGLSASQVRQTLLASRAQSEEITSLIAPDAAPKGTGTASDTGALMAAVKKLTQKI